MQTLPVIAVAVVAACASSYAFSALVSPAAAPPSGSSDAALETRVAELQDRQAELEGAVERLSTAADRGIARQEIPAISDEQVRRALGDLLEAQGLDLESLVAEAAADGGAPRLDFDTAWAQLSGGSLKYEDQEALWIKVREAGLMDEMVAAFEARAKQLSTVADAQFQLGNAYLQKLFTVADNEKAKWSMQADRSFDEALDLDETHWGARFSKAVSLSFWPAFLGRGPEAMKHFEILIDQQEASGGSRAEHAQGYLFLGNMYEQQGKSEKAREIWQRGYGLHPGSQELGAKVKK